jgi:hypothetical protein
MSIAIPQWLAPWLVGAGLVAAGLSIIFTVRAYFQLRQAGYYVVREEARRNMLRSSLLILIFVLLTLLFLFLPRQAPAPESTPTATADHTATPTVTPPAPTATATPTATPRATATEPFIPTSTPRATLPPAFESPLPSAVPPPADARFEFLTFAQGVDDNAQPVEPGTKFPVGTERIYIFFRYDGLLPNVPWTTAWYRGDELVAGGTKLWEPDKPSGERHEFLAFPGSFPEGEYEVQVWLGDRLQIRATFTVVSADG